MDGRFIVPVAPANGDGETVVVEVQQNGSRPLDVRLVGCEGENPYIKHLKHGELEHSHSFKGTDDEWEAILSAFLVQKLPEEDLPKGIRLVYELKNSNLDLLLRQDVKGIKVTLGKITLVKDEEFEFNPFEWAQVSAQAHARTLQEMADLRARVSGEQDTISKLKFQFDEFIKTKNETENEMLQQFMELLNEKKRKIRDQSRLLAGAKVDKAIASSVQSTREEAKPRKAGASRTSKRKATKAVKPEPDPEQLSDADQMEIDQTKIEAQDEDSEPGAATPDRTSDDETEDEDMPTSLTQASSAPQTRRNPSEPVPSQSMKDADSEDNAPPPARRELPFGRPVTRGRSAKKQAPPSDDDETEDEEL